MQEPERTVELPHAMRTDPDRNVVKRWFALIALVVAAGLWSWTEARGVEYERPVDMAPTAEDMGGGYEVPPVQRTLPRAAWWNIVDVAVLVTALGLSAWLGLVRRSRYGVVALTIGCLIYFGFHRQGCVCPIGAIQNVAVALTDSSYALPVVVIVFFFLPLGLAFFVGRVYCGGVCPLGAIQELVVLRPVQVPRRLDGILGWFKYVYLALAIWFAVQPAVDRDFVICRFDPFVGLFRRSGPGWMLMMGGGMLILGIFIGRPYCRYLCPYGALLAMAAKFSWTGVTITPDKELDCGLCTESCPYGSIEKMRAVRSSCLSCARCYVSCPRERLDEESDLLQLGG